MAVIGPGHEGLPVAVEACLQAAAPGHAGLVGGRKGAQLEDVVRAHAHALGFRLATIGVDDRLQARARPIATPISTAMRK